MCYTLVVSIEESPVFITIVDDAGREKRQRVEYTVTDVRVA